MDQVWKSGRSSALGREALIRMVASFIGAGILTSSVTLAAEENESEGGQGLTGFVELGYGVMTVETFGPGQANHIAFGLGWFPMRRLGVLFGASGIGRPEEGGSLHTTIWFVAGHYVATRRLWVRGGPGRYFLGLGDPDEIRGDDLSSGWGGTVTVGWDFLREVDVAARVQLTVEGSFATAGPDFGPDGQRDSGAAILGLGVGWY